MLSSKKKSLGLNKVGFAYLLFIVILINPLDALSADYSAGGGTATSPDGTATAVGSASIANGAATTAYGSNAQATGIKSTATGYSAQATGLLATATGYQAIARGERTTAIGYLSEADNYSSVALGNYAEATGNTSAALGAYSHALGDYSIASGGDAYATGFMSIAIGQSTNAAVNNSIAIGSYSQAAAAHTGNYTVNGGNIAATSSAGGTMSVGAIGKERQIQNVAAGVVSTTSTDAINGSQLYAVGSQVNSMNDQVNGIANNVSALGQNTMRGFSNAYGMINNNQKEARQGIAMAAAMSQAPMPSAPGKTSWKFNNAVYKNAAATSLSIAHRLPTKVPVAVTAGVAIGLKNSAIVTGGLQGEF